MDILGTDVTATHSDDHPELDLVDYIMVLIALKCQRRSWHYEGSHGLIEPHWLSWSFSTLVVFTNTDNLALVLGREISLVKGFHSGKLSVLSSHRAKIALS